MKLTRELSWALHIEIYIFLREREIRMEEGKCWIVRSSCASLIIYHAFYLFSSMFFAHFPHVMFLRICKYSIYKKYSYDEEWAVSCGCVVLCGSGAGDVQGALDDGRGSFGYKGEGCSCLDFGSGMGASVYLGPAAEAACRNGSTAAGCPESPCPIFPPRSCNTTYCRYIRKEFGKLTVHTIVFPRVSSR